MNRLNRKDGALSGPGCLSISWRVLSFVVIAASLLAAAQVSTNGLTLKPGDNLLLENNNKCIVLLIGDNDQFVSTERDFPYGVLDRYDSVIILHPIKPFCRWVNGERTFLPETGKEIILAPDPKGSDSIEYRTKGEGKRKFSLKRVEIAPGSLQGLRYFDDAHDALLLYGKNEFIHIDGDRADKGSYSILKGATIAARNGDKRDTADLAASKKISVYFYDSLFKIVKETECKPQGNRDSLIALLKSNGSTVEKKFEAMAERLGIDNYSIVNKQLMEIFYNIPNFPMAVRLDAVYNMCREQVEASGIPTSSEEKLREGLKAKLSEFGVKIAPADTIRTENLLLAWCLEKTTRPEKKKDELYRCILNTLLAREGK
jgi:hypothetical protein